MRTQIWGSIILAFKKLIHIINGRSLRFFKLKFYSTFFPSFWTCHLFLFGISVQNSLFSSSLGIPNLFHQTNNGQSEWWDILQHLFFCNGTCNANVRTFRAANFFNTFVVNNGTSVKHEKTAKFLQLWALQQAEKGYSFVCMSLKRPQSFAFSLG